MPLTETINTLLEAAGNAAFQPLRPHGKLSHLHGKRWQRNGPSHPSEWRAAAPRLTTPPSRALPMPAGIPPLQLAATGDTVKHERAPQTL
jgi:hypothetical protein